MALIASSPHFNLTCRQKPRAARNIYGMNCETDLENTSVTHTTVMWQRQWKYWLLQVVSTSEKQTC